MRLVTALTILCLSSCGKSEPPAPAPATTAAPATTPPSTSTPPTTAPEPAKPEPAKPEPEPAKPEPEPAKPEPEPTPGALQGTWCIILGTGTLTEYDKLQKPLAKMKEAGFAYAGIYDARDFATFAWGHLVLIAEATADKESADAKAAEAKKNGLNPFVKECPHTGALPIASAADVRADWPLPTTPLVLKPTTKDAGFDLEVLGWTDATQELVHVHERSSIQSGGKVELMGVGEPLELASWPEYTFEGFPKPTLAAEVAARLNAALTEDGFVALQGTAAWLRPLPVKGVLRWADPDVTVTWTRKTERNNTESGSWNEHVDTFVVRCGGRDQEWASLTTNDDEPVVKVGLVPAGASGKRSLVLLWKDSWGIEGDRGSSRDALTLELTDCLAAKVEAPR